jgi:hypothetical protein
VLAIPAADGRCPSLFSNAWRAVRGRSALSVET